MATNIYPVRSVCTINYRPMPGTDVNALVDRARRKAKELGIKFKASKAGDALYASPEAQLVKTALKLTGTRKPATVAYGTDGLAYSKNMKNLVVLGPGNIAQAHTVDEWVEVEQLEKGVDLYTRFIDYVCVQGKD